MTADMSAVIVAKSDQWNADDFTAGPRTFTIESVSIKPGTEQPVQIKLAGTPKFFRPCKTISRVLVAGWGADANQYVGRSLTLFTDPGVTWGGMKVGGIRVSHMSDLTQPLVIALQEKKGSRKMTTVQPLKSERAEQGQAEYTRAQAERDVMEATDIHALGAVWKVRRMAPYRELLEPLKDERRAFFEREGRDDADMGDAHDGIVAFPA